MASSIPSRISSVALATLMIGALVVPLVPGPAQAKDAAELRAREQFFNGQQAYAAGKYEEALASFSEAYGLQPVPGFLFDIAQCHRQLGNYERAAVFYQQYLELSPSKENAATVRGLLAEARAAEKERKRRLTEQERFSPDNATRSNAPERRWDLEGAIAHADQKDGVSAASMSSGSILQKWWFWTGIGVVTAGTTAYLLTSQRSPDGNGAGNSR
jgi:tetratricopeptide (TPR) repeat protein